jgi:hypothetical protein
VTSWTCRGEIAGLRDVLIHDYPNLDLERIWLVASRDVPELLRVIEDFLREYVRLEAETTCPQVPQARGRRIFLPIRREGLLVKDGDLQVVRNLCGY